MLRFGSVRFHVRPVSVRFRFGPDPVRFGSWSGPVRLGSVPRPGSVRFGSGSSFALFDSGPFALLLRLVRSGSTSNSARLDRLQLSKKS